MGKLKNNYYQLATMILLTLATQLFSLVKGSMIAANFGATLEMDAFNFSNSIGTFIFSFITTGITTVLIPAIINKTDSKAINSFITIIYGFSIVIVSLLIFFRYDILNSFNQYSINFIEFACQILIITLLGQFFTTVTGVTNAVFQCNEKYNIPKIINLIVAIVTVICLFINNHMSIYGYSLLILFINLFIMIVNIYLVEKNDFKYRITLDIKNSELKSMFKVFVPTLFSTGLYQIALLTDSMISSTLGEGQLSILSYSNTIVSMINTLLVGNLMLYIYPKITKNIQKKQGQLYLFDSITIFNVFLCLVIAGFFVVGKDFIQLLYQRGSFNSNLTTKVFICTLIYIIGMPINVMRDSIYRFFYAKGNTKSTFYNSIYVSILNIIISIILSKFIGIYGLIIGTVLTSIFSFTRILIVFKKNYSFEFDKKHIIKENAKVFITTILTIVILLFIKQMLGLNLLIMRLIVYGTLTCIIYILLLILLKSKIHKLKI